VSTQAWIFLVGLRVLDLGALVVWLVWFFKLRDEPDDGEDEGGGGPPVEPPTPSCGPHDGVPLPDAGPWPVRLRDHASRAPARPLRRCPERTPTYR
jgi:hypothetical protein